MPVANNLKWLLCCHRLTELERRSFLNEKQDMDNQEFDLDPYCRQVCERIRQLRKQHDWTLEQLASLSGVSRSMLSQIERGSANPTLGVAHRIAQAFGLSLGDLVETNEQTGRIEVIRADDETYFFRDDEQCRIRTLSPLHLEKSTEFYELVLKPNGVLTSSPHFEGTREFLTVQKGTVKVTANQGTNELSKGDSAHYSADVPHQIENIGRGEAIAFLVNIYERTTTGK